MGSPRSQINVGFRFNARTKGSRCNGGARVVRTGPSPMGVWVSDRSPCGAFESSSASASCASWGRPRWLGSARAGSLSTWPGTRTDH